MCRCCQDCWESCYWSLIEEKFCFDESIALYQEPDEKKPSEKNNNMFDNMAFFDSVSVIAGRAIVTIDPLEVQKKQTPVMEQPRKRLKWPEKNSKALQSNYLSDMPFIKEEKPAEKPTSDTDGGESETQEALVQKKVPNRLHEKFQIKKSVSFHNIPEKTSSSSGDESDYVRNKNLVVPEEEEVTLRVGKSLRERRMSKSLSLKIIDFPKELPIIRQNSMPKFYLDTPDENQMKDSALVKTSTVAMKTPAPAEFNFDLQSVVQLQKDIQTSQAKQPPAPIHRETSKLNLLKDKILLKKSKSTLSASSLPHTNHM